MFASWLKTNKVHTLDFSGKTIPKAADRTFWERLSEEDKRLYISEAESFLGYEFPIIKATDFMEFFRSGSRKIMEDKHFPRRMALCALAIGECIEHKGRFLDELVNVIFMICEETYWGVSAHMRDEKNIPSGVKPNLDLFAGETGADLAIVRYMLYDELMAHVPEIIERLDRELTARIITPYFTDFDLWWMGHHGNKLHNWTPWVISNVLLVLSYFEKDERTVKSGVQLAINTLQLYINDYPKDGGCDEGPSYWGASCAALFDCVDVLYEMSGGKMNFYGEPLLRSMLDYIEKVYISGKYYVNFADSPAKPAAIASSTAYRFAKAVGNENVARIAAKQLREELVPRKLGRITKLGRAMKGLMCREDIQNEKDPDALATEFVLDKTEILTARENSNENGLYLAVKGGTNVESHNHNDVGNFIVYYDGEPVLIDAGSSDYTRQTFSEERYTLFFTRSDWHSVPTVNGVCQHQDEKYRSSGFKYEISSDLITLDVGIEGAYPSESGLLKLGRSVSFERVENALIKLTDSFDFENEENEITENIILHKKPEINDGSITLFTSSGKKLKMTVCADKYETDLVPQTTAGSRNLQASWGEGTDIWKLEIKIKCGKEAKFELSIEK